MNIACPSENELKLMQYADNKQLSPDLKESHSPCQEFYCANKPLMKSIIPQQMHNTGTLGDHSAFASSVDHLIFKGKSNSNEIPDRYVQI